MTENSNRTDRRSRVRRLLSPARPTFRDRVIRSAVFFGTFVAVFAGFVGAVALGWSPGVQWTEPRQSAQAPAPSAEDRRITALMEKHECSNTGLGDDVKPYGSLVMDEETREVRVESFEVGWEAYESKSLDLTLLAVCAVGPNGERAPTPSELGAVKMLTLVLVERHGCVEPGDWKDSHPGKWDLPRQMIVGSEEKVRVMPWTYPAPKGVGEVLYLCAR